MPQTSVNERNSRLVLGTVQLGMPYGVANTSGQPDENQAADIVRQAWDSGIREFDTAQGYGQSESVLGRVFARVGICDKVRVISKFHPRLDHSEGKVLLKALDESLNQLRVPSLYGILLHKEDLLDRWSDGVGKALRDLQQTGKVEKVGVSVYSLARAMTALQTPGIDLIQLPANLCDRRFEDAGFFKLAEQRNITIYIRSIFLQGLLLMDIRDVPAYLSSAQRALEILDGLCGRYGLTRRELALGYVGSRMPKAKIIFGVETVEQLRQNIASWNKDYPRDIDRLLGEALPDLPHEIINPVLWKK